MLSWKRLSTTLLAIGAAAAAGCGDNTTPGGPIDAPPDIDGDTIDAEVPDAEVPDAMVDTYSGTITVLEASVLGIPQLGQGIQVSSTFWRDADTVAPSLDTAPGFPIGCKVYEYDAGAEIAYLEAGINEGTVSVTIDNETQPDPDVPACIHTPGGYICPDDPTCLAAPGATCLGGTLKGVPAGAPPTDTCVAGVFMLEDADAPFDFSLADGRYVSFVGSGTALLPDGAAFPVVNVLSTSAIVIPHPAATADCPGTDNAGIPLSATGLHLTVGGVGPQPVCATGNGCPDPGFVENDAEVAITLTPGGGNHIAGFTSPTGLDGTGDKPTLNASSQAIMADIPMDGSAFTVGCDDATACGDGAGVLIAIETSDGPLTGLAPYQMPPVVTKRTYIRCAALATTTVTVPAEASAFLETSGATRIQATFIRGALLGGGDNSEVTIVAGHAITAFTTP